MFPIPSKQRVEEFRALFFELHGITLNDEEAWDLATRTLQLYVLTHWPSTRDCEDKK